MKPLKHSLMTIGLATLMTGCLEPAANNPSPSSTSSVTSLSPTPSLDCSGSAPTQACRPQLTLASAILAPNGSIYLGGYQQKISDIRARLYKLDSLGRIDKNFELNALDIPSFAPLATSVIDGIAEQSDGKIVATGWLVAVDGTNKYFVARFSSVGRLDTSFGQGGVVAENLGAIYSPTANVVTEPKKVVIQPDGKIVILAETRGTFSPGQSGNDVTLIRLNTDGTLDSRFGTNGYVSGHLSGAQFSAHALDINSSGKILIVGSHLLLNNPVSDSDMSCAALQYNSDGSLDASFGNAGLVALKGLYAPTIKTDCQRGSYKADGKILMSGSYDNYVGGNHNYNALMVQLNSNGTPDSSFAGGPGWLLLPSYGLFNSSGFGDFQVLADGSMLVVHFSVAELYSVRKIAADGTMDVFYGAVPLVAPESGFVPAYLLVIRDSHFWTAGNTGSGDAPELLEFQ